MDRENGYLGNDDEKAVRSAAVYMLKNTVIKAANNDIDAAVVDTYGVFKGRV
jgi:hypothetical protein